MENGFFIISEKMGNEKNPFAHLLPSISVFAATHDHKVATLAITRKHRDNLAILLSFQHGVAQE